MELNFEVFEKFILTQECIFDYKIIDYPTPLQQKLIIAYFEVKQIFSQQHNDIVKILHSTNDRNLENIISGIIYTILYKPATAQKFFQTYMTILKSQAWGIMAKSLTQIIKQTFLSIKQKNRHNITLILSRLYYFNQFTNDLLIISIKSIDNFSLTQQSLNYCNTFLTFFHRIVCANSSIQGNNIFYLSLCYNLFYKLIRIVTVINLLDDDNVKEMKRKSIDIICRLFQYDTQQCLIVGHQLTKYFRELERQPRLQQIIDRSQKIFAEQEQNCGNTYQIKHVLSLVLPLRVQATILYLINEKCTKTQTNLQLTWVFKNSQQYYQLLLIDILKYLLFMNKQQYSQDQMMYLLQWLLYRCCSNNILYEIWKGELFGGWFNDKYYINQIQIALSFLGYMFQNNFQFGENLLVYLLRNKDNKSYAERLKGIFVSNNSLFQLGEILGYRRLGSRVREDLVGLLENKQHERVGSNTTRLYYDPLEHFNKSEVESPVFPQQNDQESMEDHYLEDENQPNVSSNSQNQINSESQIHQIKNQQQFPYQINLQKIFAQSFPQELKSLLTDPTYNNYKLFIKKLLDELKNYKLNNENDIIDIFITETSKITYLMFHYQFEDYTIEVPQNQSVIAYLLITINAEWKNGNFANQILKKIVKRIIQLFETTEASFWRYFFVHFKRGKTSNIKQFKDWLIVKQKNDIVMPLLQSLMKQYLKKEIIDNGALLKCSLS